MKRSYIKMRLFLKKYRYQISTTFIFTLILVSYNNCGKISTQKSKKLLSKTSLVSGQLVSIGDPEALLPQSGPDSPLVYLGDGRIVNNKHTAFSNLPNVAGYTPSGWQLDQTPGRELIHPNHLSSSDPDYDSLLGKANWIFLPPGRESHLKIFNNPQYGMVYELFSKNGTVGPYGGTGLILTPLDLPVQKINGKIKLDLDFRLSKVVSSYTSGNPNFHWFALSGMYFKVKNPATGALKSFLIQIVHGNYKPISEATNYRFDNGVDSPMLGGIINSDLDKVFYTEMADFKHITLDINKYMCYATKQKYGSASGKEFTMPDYFRNPNNWSFSGYFFDLEHASQTCTDPSPVYGESCPANYIKDFGDKLEIGVQVANINMTQQPVENYYDICQDYPEYNQSSTSANVVTGGGVTTSSAVLPTARFYIDTLLNGSKIINPGEKIELKYESSHAKSCTLTAYMNGNIWYKNVDFQPSYSWGKVEFNNAGTTYRWEIACKNDQGNIARATANLTVSSSVSPAAIFINNVANSNSSIKVGESVDLRYAALSMDSCTLTAYQNGAQWYKNIDFTNTHDWGRTVFKTVGTFKWVIDCKNKAGQTASASGTLNVIN